MSACKKCEDVAATLTSEAEWLDKAVRNSIDGPFHVQYRAGFSAAAGWVRLHATRYREGDMCTHHNPT